MIKKICLLITLFICLTGCINYDVGIDFPQANQGHFTQKISLSEQLSNVSEKEGHQWLKNIEKKASQLHGKTKYLSADEILVDIPFYNGQDLVEKFNQFFLTSLDNDRFDDEDISILDVSANLSLDQNNVFVIERKKLDLIADLTSLGVSSEEGEIIFSSGDLINLQVNLNLPLGATIATNEFAQWEKQEDGIYNIQLQAGKVNEISATFWVPNYVGLGSIAILLFISLGYFAKYRKLPLVN